LIKMGNRKVFTKQKHEKIIGEQENTVKFDCRSPQSLSCAEVPMCKERLENYPQQTTQLDVDEFYS
jgi:hypothetical protein